MTWKRTEILMLILMLTAAFCFPLAGTSLAGDISVLINNQRLSLEVPPQVVEGRTLVPLRAIFEALGASVEWNPEEQSIVATKGDTVLKLVIGSRTALKNGSPVQLEVAPMITGGRTLVPLRFVSENLGAQVGWDGNNHQVTIGTSGVSSLTRLLGTTSLTAVPADVSQNSAGSQAIEGLDTNTTAFIGTAAKGPVLQPTLVSSWDEYTSLFGSLDANNYLPGAVYSYFLNGGKRAYIVRVSRPNPIVRSNILPSAFNVNLGNGKSLPIIDYTSGLAPLENIDGISLVVIPGQTDQTTQNALIKHCEKMKYRFAILDSSSTAGVSGSGSVQDQMSKLSSPNGFAALYYPWINIQDPVTKNTICVPPSGAVAGLFARNDLEKGVQKAPANIPVNGVISLADSVTDSEAGQLDALGINVIRSFPGRGYLLWGDKTLAVNGGDLTWKYISVRRLSIFMEESVTKGTGWAESMPNNEALWDKMTNSVNSFLYQLWSDGALQGSYPRDAYYVKCDRSTMTQADIDNQRLVCEIGIAPAKPAEFIIIRISHQTQ